MRWRRRGQELVASAVTPPPPVAPPIPLTTEEAAAECCVAESTIRSWVARGWLPLAGKIAGKAYYWRDDVLKAERRARRGGMLADPS